MPRRVVTNANTPRLVDVLKTPAPAQPEVSPSVDEGWPDEPQVAAVVEPLAARPPTPPPPPPPAPARNEPLTPEQQRIRDLENMLAVERGGKDPEPEFDTVVGGDASIVIHFLEDGFTALGRVWYRGQELEFAADSPAYRDTCDRAGRSWLALAGDDNAQIERYGQVVFRRGPWPGKTYLDAATVPFETLKSLRGDGSVGAPPEDELKRAADAERQRQRAAPRLPVM